MGQLATQNRHRHQTILQRHPEMDKYQVAAALRRFVNRGCIVVYRVADLVGGCGFDKLPDSTAHRGTLVND